MPTYFLDEDGRYEPEQLDCQASFIILSDDLRPDQISERVGIQPDDVWIRGERNVAGAPHPHNGWAIRSRIAASLPAEDHLADVLERIAPVAAAVAVLAHDPQIFGAQVRLKRSGDNWNPGLSLSPMHIDNLNALGLGLEVNVYVYETPNGSISRPHDPPPTTH